MNEHTSVKVIVSPSQFIGVDPDNISDVAARYTWYEDIKTIVDLPVENGQTLLKQLV